MRGTNLPLPDVSPDALWIAVRRLIIFLLKCISFVCSFVFTCFFESRPAEAFEIKFDMVSNNHYTYLGLYEVTDPGHDQGIDDEVGGFNHNISLNTYF